MRKLFKTPALLLSTAALLTSCSNDSIAGTYGFQMGKANGTHFGLYLKLTDKYTTIATQPEVKKKYKKCEFSFSFKLGEDTEGLESIITMIASLLGEKGDKIKVPGYYYKGSYIKKEEATELKLGVDFSFFKDIFDELDIADIDFPVLSPEKIEKIIYTTYSSNKVTLNVPVSEADVIYQLYWYGIDFSYSKEEGVKIVDLPAEQCHKPGTHPSATDVTYINETLKYYDNHQAFIEEFGFKISSYRDYYTLAMGLVKQ